MIASSKTGVTTAVRGALLLAMLWFAGSLGCLLPPQPDDDDRPGGGDDDATWGDDDDDDDDMTPPGDDDTGDDDTGDDDTGDDDFTAGGDEDHDGYTTEQGDCDDHNPDVYPGADDLCDPFDNDCDGRLNEDSIGYDMFEPNDQNGFDLGDLTGTLDTVDSFIHEPDDEDRFLFFVEDGYIDWFDIVLDLSGVPQGVDLALELYLVDDVDHNYVGLVASADDGGPGDAEYIDYDGSYWGDDTGMYEVLIYSESGYDCDDAYVIIVSGGG